MTRKLLLPVIETRINKEWDKILFLNFVRSGGANKRKIFWAHPELEKTIGVIEDTRGQEKIISDYIDRLYLQYQSALEKIVERESQVLERAQREFFSGLEKVMGCGWDSSDRFFASPTFLPFNPFGKNCFYFSVYDETIRNKPSARRVDRIAIHELSHICWYQKLNEAYEELGFELNKAANYYLKEAFAVVIGECDEFFRINKGFSPPNKNVALLQIRVDSEELEFVDFFRKLFGKRREEGLEFDAILKEALEIGHGIQELLEEKMSIWNKYSGDPSKLRERGYLVPIDLPVKKQHTET